MFSPNILQEDALHSAFRHFSNTEEIANKMEWRKMLWLQECN